MYLLLEITTQYLLLDKTVHNRSKCCILFRSSYTIVNINVHIEDIDILQKYEYVITICLHSIRCLFLYERWQRNRVFFYSFQIKIVKRITLFC